MALQFSYHAMTGDGRPSNGMASATSPAELRRILREQGLFLVTAEPATARASSSGRFQFRRGVKKNDLLNLTSQLAIMAQAGVDVASALEMLSAECANPQLKKALKAVHERVSAGEAVSDALRSQSHIFGEAYVASVAAGEASGKLHLVLSRLAQLLRADIRLSSTLRSLLAYPVVLLVVSVSVLIALIFFVLPTFAEVFNNMGVALPAITRILLDVSAVLTAHSWAPIALVIGGVAGMIFLLRNPTGRRYYDRAILRIPMIQVITRNLAIGRAFRLLGTMLESGVPLMESLGLCQSSLKNSVFRELFHQVAQDVLSGKGMSQALARSPIMPPAVGGMIATGERTGNLGVVLQLLGDHYESEAETRFKDLATMLEPALVIFVGGLVAVVVLSLVLPMFDFTATAGNN